MEPDGIIVKYKDIGSFEFSQVMQKITNQPTHHAKANHIRKVAKFLSEIRKRVTEEYQKDIVEVYGARDEKNQLKRPEGDPVGFIPMEDKIEEFTKAQEAFGERTGVVKWRPLTPSSLSDVKLSARELDLLKDLYSEEEGPGVPHMVGPGPMGNVAQMHN